MSSNTSSHRLEFDLLPSVFGDELNATVPSAYGGWNLEAMDSHGGWVASAVDLARFACAFDEPAKCKLLNESSVARMFARPSGLSNTSGGTESANFYSCGWSNRLAGNEGRIESSHTGSLPGTATLLVRRRDGRNFVVLFNARSSAEASHFGQAIQSGLAKAIDAIKQWPEIDLFSEF
jgi:N-acyl-D-amino-acid deacylase